MEVATIHRMKVALAALVAALTLAGTAAAADVRFDGGTPFEQQQVTQALASWRVDTSSLPTITVHVVPPSDPHLGNGAAAGYSIPGDVWLSSYWLDFGQAGWGFVQHEFGHELDYYVLTDAQRAELMKLFGASTWCDHSQPYTERACEWFASELSWAFWPTQTNLQDPGTTNGLSGHVDPAKLRALIESFGLAQPQRVCTTKVVPGHWVRKGKTRVWIHRRTTRTCRAVP